MNVILKDIFSNKKKDVGYYRYSPNFIVISWFIGFGITIQYVFSTVISIDATFHLYILMGLIATGIHFLFSKVHNKQVLVELAVYNFVGVAALACGLFLMSNFIFRGNTNVESHKIVAIKKEFEGFSLGKNHVTLENEAYGQFGYLLNYNQWSWDELDQARKIEVKTANGLFGYKVILDKRLKY